MIVHRDGYTFQVTDHHDGDDFWTRYYEHGWEAEQAAVLDLIPAGGTLIDIGAWIGPWTIPAAIRGIQVDAWEPDPVAYERLTANLRLNQLSNVAVWNAALVPDDKSQLVLRAQSDVWGGSNSGRWAQGTITRIVPAIRISSALDPGAFVKMDVEGDEIDLFPIVAAAHHNCHVSLHQPLARLAGDTADYRAILQSSFARYRTLIIDSTEITPDAIPYDQLCSITCLT